MNNMRASAERASLEICRIFTFQNYYFLQYHTVGISHTLSQKHISFQVSSYICILQSMQFPVITYGMALYRQYVDKTLKLRKSMYMRASGASELRKFSHYYISKTAISFNILLVLQILCRYKWHACRLTCTDNFQMYRQNSKNALLGGGGGAIAPPPGYANANDSQAI